MYATRSRKKETGTGASRAGNRSKRFTVIELSKIQVFTEWYLNTCAYFEHVKIDLKSWLVQSIISIFDCITDIIYTIVRCNLRVYNCIRHFIVHFSRSLAVINPPISTIPSPNSTSNKFEKNRMNQGPVERSIGDKEVCIGEWTDKRADGG